MNNTTNLAMEDIAQMEAEFVIPIEKDKPAQPKRAKKDKAENSTGEQASDI